MKENQEIKTRKIRIEGIKPENCPPSEYLEKLATLVRAEFGGCLIAGITIDFVQKATYVTLLVDEDGSNLQR